jgi:hypothetical protein
MTLILSFFLSFFLVIILNQKFLDMKNVKNVILFVFSVALFGMMSCEEAALEETALEEAAFVENSSIDFVTVSNDKGILDSYEIDRESGTVISSSTNSTSKSDVINGTVYRIEHHENGNRTIYCRASDDICYTQDIGPGPCADCT